MPLVSHFMVLGGLEMILTGVHGNWQGTQGQTSTSGSCLEYTENVWCNHTLESIRATL